MSRPSGCPTSIEEPANLNRYAPSAEKEKNNSLTSAHRPKPLGLGPTFQPRSTGKPRAPAGFRSLAKPPTRLRAVRGGARRARTRLRALGLVLEVLAEVLAEDVGRDEEIHLGRHARKVHKVKRSTTKTKKEYDHMPFSDRSGESTPSEATKKNTELVVLGF